MRLYNTLTKKVETFKPQNDTSVLFYSCGPTVYDYPHIGNWYTFIRYDLLVRALKLSGYKVNWVMNITDVGHLVSDADEGEDKLEKGAKREGKTAWEIAKKYTDYFKQGMMRLNLEHPNGLPKATDHITEQIDLIRLLDAKKHTYVIDDGIYFDTASFPDYGKMAHLDLSHQLEGARVGINEQKRNPSDFALWKFTPEGQKRDMEWESPWGAGFPGWHIECSAMSMKYLGETLDIHGGGIDHIPVHHTNEIAQSEGATGKQFSRFWFHSNFNLVDGKKMSKSLNNFITLEDIEKRGFDLMAFRLLVLQSHYRTEAHFTWVNLQAAQNRLEELNAMADMLWQPLANSRNMNRYAHRVNITNALANDLSTPEALSLLAAISSDIIENSIHADEQPKLVEFLHFLDSALGMSLGERQDITATQKTLLSQRQEARDRKDYHGSDAIRDKLKEQGIAVRDTSNGQVWSRL